MRALGRRIAWRALAGPVLAFAVLAGFAACAGQVMTPGPAAASTRPAAACPPRQPAPHCLRGKVILWDPKGDPNAAELVIDDGYGATMMVDDMYGLYSFGEPVCVTDWHWSGGRLPLLACLGGPWSQQGASPVLTLYDRGRPVSVTVAQLEQLEALLAAGLTPADVRKLHAAGL